MSPPVVEFRLLGPVDITIDGRPQRLTALKQRAVLAMLALAVGRVVSTDALAEGVWGERPPDSVRNVLKSLMSRLRRTLADAGDDTVRLMAVPPGYVLAADADRVDAARFAALAGIGRAALAAEDPPAAAAALRAALGLWRGRALEDLAELPFARAEVARLGEVRLAAVEDLAEAELGIGHHDDVVAALEPHVAANPFRERAWGQLMLALYRSGRQADSLRAFRTLRRILGEELGIEPSPALRRLEEHILLQRPEVEGQPVAQDPGPPEGAHNLPVLLSRFVGREHERRRVSELLASARLVTLTGSGGVGKTRLALEVSGGLVPTFADGVFFVDLVPVSDPALLVAHLVAVLGLAPGQEQAKPAALVDHLVGHLARRRVLIVFDNCEHLVRPVGALVHELLSRCPPLVVLATSRERLGIAGETVWRVPSLSVPPVTETDPAELARSDAVALFCDRARSLDADFVLDAGNAAAVARICQQLEGIPLAIELATARLGVLDPTEIAERLDQRLGLLARGSAAGPARHETLQACLEWGHELLASAERALLRRLSVLAGHFDLEAAEAVAGEAPASGADVLDLLSRLVDTSWVSVAAGRGGTRFRLTETVRQYARERLVAAGEEEEFRRRHRDHFRLAAGGYQGPPLCASRWWLSKVSADYENIAAALEWSWQSGDTDTGLWLAGRLFAYWALDGRFHEGRLWLERALDADVGPPGPTRVWGLVSLGLLLVQLGDVDAGLTRWREAQDLATAAGDPDGGAYASGYLSLAAVQDVDPREGERALNDVRGILAAAGLGAGAAWCDFNLGWAHLARFDRAGATTAFERALAFGRQQGSDVLVTHALGALASLRALQGDAAGAGAAAEEALTAARSLGLRHVLVMALSRAAEAAALLGDTTRAEGRTREALRTVREIGGRMWVSDLLQLAALVAEERGSRDVAVRMLAAGSGTPGWPVSGGEHRPIHRAVEACRARLEAALDAGAFAAEWQVGRALSADAAVDAALAALDPGWAPWISGHRERRTFMFTDIVRSTELAELLGDEAWGQLLHWHDETLRTLFAAHRGDEIKHTGDGFFVAFERPEQALDCAAAVQGGLARRRAEGGPALHVRIGLHRAEAIRSGRDYHGKGVHEAARIAALAGPDEILASLVTLDMTAAPAAFGEPRTVTLQGISEPMEVVSVPG
jgi:predicted ATPase/DNA-binding SARP family transcriptional activator/class 3 adenylate cyclase